MTSPGQPMTLEDYLAFEERSEIRHELVNNQLIPLPGTTIFHNAICLNLSFLLRTLLKKGMFRIVQENVKVQIKSNQIATTHTPTLRSQAIRKICLFKTLIFVKKPSVIIEVMAKSSRIEDTADKFIRYKSLESLRNYLLVDSEKQLVEVRTKLENGDWESETYLPADARFPIPSLNIELTFEGVYEGVHISN